MATAMASPIFGHCGTRGRQSESVSSFIAVNTMSA
jgi:hypothetical protein